VAITFLTGDCRDILPTLADASVQCVVTSPPYFGLRDYGTGTWEGGDAACDHIKTVYKRQAYGGSDGASGKNCQSWRGGERNQSEPYGDTCGKCGAVRVDRQIGLEPTPDAFVATLVAVFREVRRVMRPDATLWCNLGDGFRDKQLLGMPWRVALALQADGWFLRSSIIWAKPNPMPESCRDRPTSAHEHVFLLTKRSRYFFDADAVREDAEYGRRDTAGAWRGGAYVNQRPGQDNSVGTGLANSVTGRHPETGRACRNVWTIATEAFPAAHFATYPTALAERCIRAGTSEKGCCSKCAAPWVRITEMNPEYEALAATNRGWSHAADGMVARQRSDHPSQLPWKQKTTGWAASCKCQGADVVPCCVLDPFSGAGTTALVADRLQRNAIAIDLSHEYRDMAAARYQADAGMFADTGTATLDESYDRPMRDLFAYAAD
jgi:DNA modification methylase